MKKLVTIVIPARNDSYYDNFSSIINFLINYSLSKIFELKFENIFEILLVDWGSKDRLNQDVYIPRKFRKNIKIIHVSNQGNKGFQNYFNVGQVQNFGLKLCKTKFCYLTHADQIYSKSFYVNLVNFVKYKYLSKNKTENSLLYIPRKFIDSNYFSSYPKEQTIDDYFDNLSFVTQKWKNDQYYVGGGHSGWFGTKKILEKYGGLKEDLILENKKDIIGSDVEFYQRFSQYINFYDSSNFGIFAFRYPYFFSKNRNLNLLRRMPPLIIDDAKKIKIKKKNFEIEKFNNKKIKKLSKLPKYNIIFGGNTTQVRKYFHYAKFEIVDKANENLKKNFLIREFLIESIFSKKIISYLEYGYNGHSVISVIGNLFKGIDILAADFTFKYKKQKIHQRLFKLAYFFHSKKIIERYGKTKLISFKNIYQSSFIFSYLQKEKLKTIMTVNPDKINIKLFKTNILKIKHIFYCIIITSNTKKFNFLKKDFNKVNVYKDLIIYFNKLNTKGESKLTYLNLKYYFYRIIKIFFSA